MDLSPAFVVSYPVRTSFVSFHVAAVLFLSMDVSQLDKYMPSVSLIDDVFRIKARGLLVAGFASAVMLAWFSTIMYIVERADDEVKVRSVARGSTV